MTTVFVALGLGNTKDKPLSTRGQRGVPLTRKLTRSPLSPVSRHFSDRSRCVAAAYAGYSDIAPFEQLSSERFEAVVDTNFYGVVNVTRAALPIMHKQRSGYIFRYRRWTVA